MKRSQRKFLRRCQELCAGCAWRPGTDASEARLGRPRSPLDADLREQIRICTETATPFYCHEYGVDDGSGALVVPENRMKLCPGWVAELRTANGIKARR